MMPSIPAPRPGVSFAADIGDGGIHARERRITAILPGGRRAGGQVLHLVAHVGELVGFSGMGHRDSVNAAELLGHNGTHHGEQVAVTEQHEPRRNGQRRGDHFT
jgi:hypothetical protein